LDRVSRWRRLVNEFRARLLIAATAATRTALLMT